MTLCIIALVLSAAISAETSQHMNPTGPNEYTGEALQMIDSILSGGNVPPSPNLLNIIGTGDSGGTTGSGTTGQGPNTWLTTKGKGPSVSGGTTGTGMTGQGGSLVQPADIPSMHGAGAGSLDIGHVQPSSNLHNIIGTGDSGATTGTGMTGQGVSGGTTGTGMTGQGGSKMTFSLQEVNTMIRGMDNGYRYKQDGTVSYNAADNRISMEQLRLMRNQLQGIGSATGTKYFTIQELRMMIDGMNNGFNYNRQGQVTTINSGVPVYKIEELRNLLSQQEALEQVVQQFPLADIQRMVRGSESGLRYNYQGQIATERQNIVPPYILRRRLSRLEAQGGSLVQPADIPRMHGAGAGSQDIGLKSIAQFTLDQVRSMIAGMEGGIRYNFQGKPATGREATLTSYQLQRFLNEILSKGIMPTADFTKADLLRMQRGIANGLQYNFQGQMALKGQARLTEGRIQELLDKLAAKGPMSGESQTTDFTIADVKRMLSGMDQGYSYNVQGLQAAPGEKTLRRGYLDRLLTQLSPNRGFGNAMKPPSFAMEDITRMLMGMDNGKTYNFDGMEARRGDRVLERWQLEQYMDDLKRKGMAGGPGQRAKFTAQDLERMISATKVGEKFNHEGLPAAIGDPVLSEKKLKDLLQQLTSSSGITGTMDGSTSTTQTNESSSGQITGTDQLGNIFDSNFSSESSQSSSTSNTVITILPGGAGGSNVLDLNPVVKGQLGTQTPDFTIQQIRRMMEGMRQGFRYNNQGEQAKPNEEPITMNELSQYLTNAKTKDESGLGIPSSKFTRDEIITMINGINSGQSYNYDGLPAVSGEKILTIKQLDKYLKGLSATGEKLHIPDNRFTIPEINRMIADIRNGIQYNYYGATPIGNEKILTADVLTKLLRRLDGQEPYIPDNRFTIPEINRMIEDIRTGIQYNYNGATPVGNEKRLTVDVLTKLLRRLDGQEPYIPDNRFTIPEINRMIEDIRTGIQYNYNGVTPVGNEKRLTVDVLTKLLRRIDGQEPYIPDNRFTIPEINRMIEDIRTGIQYNYNGVTPVGNEKRLTVDVLTKLLRRLDGQEPYIPDNRFTIPEINRMIEDIRTGIQYNYNGVTPVGNEKRLTVDVLTKLLRRLDGQEPYIPDNRFTIPEINRMIEDIRTGIQYNYNGATPVGNEKRLTVDVLTKLLRRLDGQESYIPDNRFTIPEINRMIEDIRTGIQYNYIGVTPVGNEKRLTVDVLTKLLRRLDGQEPYIPDNRFTIPEINRMIEDIRTGIQYNYNGVTPVGNEKRLTVDVLTKLLRRLDGQEPYIPDNRFTIPEINRMIEDIRTGIQYNYNGVTPVGNEKRLTVDVLTKLLRRLDGQEPYIPDNRFTIPEINRMIEDIRTGIQYNYNGVTPVGNEKRLTVDVLTKLLRRLDGQEPYIPDNRFTIPEINRMIEDIRTGIQYNYNGVTPVGNEKRLTVDVLTKLLRRLDGQEPYIPDNRFTIPAINRMIEDIRTGIQYNYNGVTPVGNEKRLTVDVLTKLLRRLDGQEPYIPDNRFTIPEINRMIEDIRTGIQYNYNGATPVGNEKRLTVDVLTKLLRRLDGQELQIPDNRFTIPEINRMIADIKNGIQYNYYGATPVGNEKKLTVAVLTKLLRRIDGQEPYIPDNRFTIPEINRMIADIKNGIQYNYYGATAVGNEKKLTVAVLTKLLRRLDGQEPYIPDKRFTIPEINRMIADIKNGIQYNYYGATPVGNEKILTADVLTKLLRRLDGQEPYIPDKRFTIPEINRMIADIKNGIQYNYYGATPVGNEKILTADVLTKLLRRLDGQELYIPDKRFTIPEINRMIADIKNGIKYNYYGATPVGNEKILTADVLTKLLRRLDGQEPYIPDKRFTIPEINRMIADIKNGIQYNYYGATPVGNEKILTADVLTKLLRRLDGQELYIPDKRFTIPEINRMIADIKNGIKYNYYGATPVGNEKILTADVLTKLLRRLDGQEPYIPDKRFTIPEINRMIADIKNGIQYNYYGATPVGNEKILTADVLTKLLRRLDGQELYIPDKRFTIPEINRMIADIKNGIKYNYYGATPVGNEKILTADVLTKLLRRLDGQEPYIPDKRFTIPEINRMIADIKNGIQYNYYGATPVGNEKILTADVLTKLLRRLDGQELYIPDKRFTIPEIQRMIADIKNGIQYNYYGTTPVGNEKILTADVLTKLLRRLDARSKFTLVDINRMLEGLGRGEAYNLEGKVATAGEPTITKGRLKQIAKDLMAATPVQPLVREFTLDEIYRMLDGIDKGKIYNNQGVEASLGEPTISRNQLTESLVKSLMRNYNIEDVNRMLSGMNGGTLYNYQGNVAAPGDRTWLKDQLELLLIYLIGLRYDNVAANKRAEISTVYDPAWTADKGVDRNRNQNMFHDSCFHTKYERDPYFIVDLGAVYNLDYLVIFNRKDCCENRAKNLEISTGLSRYNMNLQDFIPGSIGPTEVIQFMPRHSARYVKIQRKNVDPGYLHLCEVEAYGTYIREGADNLAYRKPTEMSSLYQYNNIYSSEKGVDGNTSGTIVPSNENTCFHTGKDRRPWWKVDLGAVYDLERIVLHNRRDCCSERAHDLQILAARTNTDNPIPIYTQAGNLGPLKEITLPYGTQGRIVMIRINDPVPEYLHLCEVQIYGTLAGKESQIVTPFITLTREEAIHTFDQTSSRANLLGGQNKFTMDDINRMLAGLGKGEAYNTEGRIAIAGEPKVTVGELKQIAKDLVGATPPSPLRRDFTLDQINKMLDGIGNGKSYNNQGVEASIGESTISRNQLTDSLVKNLMRNYNIDAVNRMLSGMNNGTSYNYQGNVAAPGDRTWLKDQLELLLIYLIGLRYDNVAANKRAEISTVYDPAWTADKGVDRNRNQNMFHDSCFHTKYERDPYFIVDLGAVYNLDYLVIFNRQDCCENRAKNLEISTGLSRYNMNLQDFIPGSIGPTEVIQFMPRHSARYVKIQRKNVDPGYLHLCEVEAYGTYIREGADNLAYRKPTEMSSLYQYNNIYSGEKGVDGNTSGTIVPSNENTCFHTGKDRRPWWKVDLGAVYDLERIVLHNRRDCCSERAHDLQILAARTNTDNPIPIYTQAGNLGPLKEITLPYGTQGRIVMIRINDPVPEYLHLCEVQIYGTLAGKGGQNKFTMDDINRMLAGLGKGEAYNTEGRIAIAGEPKVTVGELKQIAKDLVGATPPPPLRRDFTLDEINKMLDGIGNGKRYNNQGVEASIGESTISRNQLTDSLVKSLMRNYNIDAVNRMLSGMNNGTSYNYQGNVAAPGDRTWLKDQLELLLIYLIGLRYDNVAANKRAEISTVYDPAWTADKGVDRNRNQNMFHDSCFHTKYERNPYFELDLGAVYNLDYLVIFNRQDCCDERANNLEISTGLSRYNKNVQKFIHGSIGSTEIVRFKPRHSARYVKIQSKNIEPGYLHLCEVEAYGTYIREDLCEVNPCMNGGTCTNIPGDGLCICAYGWTGTRCQISTDNIAYGKPTEMSSLYQYNNIYSSEKGVDGNTSGIIVPGNENSCFHTDKDRRPWWKVDLGAVYDLDRIVLHNRRDCCSNRAHDVEVLAGLTNNDMVPIYYQAGNLGLVKEIPVRYGTEAQFVMIQIKDLKPEYLHLCEVKIFGNFIRKDRCTTNPCKNGGTCTNKAGSDICICPVGWGGIFCMRDESQTGTTYPTVTDSPVPPTWNGSYEAVCNQANCNLPVCYIPYPDDCKSYVVCQRTALGTYVGWKMRCAFGSYWGSGKKYTCERVEDLAKQGYICPNDPCADRTLTRYVDKEIQNCRTFWKCENGVSKPDCCGPGRKFDEYSLKCVKDPRETCRKPCPLKIDGCSVPGARTQPFYDGNCRSYWDCQGGHPHPVCCGSGMSFDVSRGHCKKDPTCTDLCPSDYTTKVCGKITDGKPVQSYALADGKCRTYMKCSAKGYDDPYCCRQDYYYDVTTAQCMLIENMLDVCRYERCPPGYKEECRFTPVEGKPTQFWDTDALVVKDCAPGTQFAPDICTCDGSSQNNDCKAEVWTKFDHLDDKWSVKNYGDGWISVFGEMSKNSTGQGRTFGYFDGSSGMEVWRYDHTAFPAVTLEMTFKPEVSIMDVGRRLRGGRHLDKQIMVSNCKSVDNGHASFEVTLHPRTSNLVFKGKSRFNSAEISLPYNRTGWNTFKLFFDGDHLVGLVEDPYGYGITEKRFAYLRGDIVAGVGALKFGPCLDSFSMPEDNGFVGKMSEVKFSKCIDRLNRQYVGEHIVPETRYTPTRN